MQAVVHAGAPADRPIRGSPGDMRLFLVALLRSIGRRVISVCRPKFAAIWCHLLPPKPPPSRVGDATAGAQCAVRCSCHAVVGTCASSAAGRLHPNTCPARDRTACTAMVFQIVRVTSRCPEIPRSFIALVRHRHGRRLPTTHARRTAGLPCARRHTSKGMLSGDTPGGGSVFSRSHSSRKASYDHPRRLRRTP